MRLCNYVQDRVAVLQPAQVYMNTCYWTETILRQAFIVIEPNTAQEVVLGPACRDGSCQLIVVYVEELHSHIPRVILRTKAR